MKFWQHPLNKQISSFNAWIDEKQAEGYLTQEQTNVGLAAALQFLASTGQKAGEIEEATLPVFRQCYEITKRTTSKECPVLEHEISTFDTKDSPFWTHSASRDIQRFHDWLCQKHFNEGKLTYDQFQEIQRVGGEVYRASGLPRGPDVDAMTVAVFRQQLHVMKTKTAEYAPHLVDEIRNMSSSPLR